jgi:hypothetical protein
MRQSVEGFRHIHSDYSTIDILRVTVGYRFNYINKAFLSVSLAIEALLCSRANTIYNLVDAVIYCSRDNLIHVR